MAVWYNFQNSIFRCKNMNSRLVAVFKILHFAVKNERPFGYNYKILYFPVKKPLAVWVHAFSGVLQSKEYIFTITITDFSQIFLGHAVFLKLID